MKGDRLLGWLRERDKDRLESLRVEADRSRADRLGEAVHLRGLIELSNICQRRCQYCGLSAENPDLRRYRMSGEAILACADLAANLGCGTVVLQCGEDEGLSIEWLAELIGEIKRRHRQAVTLSLGELPLESYERLRRAGADRALLRFETSGPALYRRLHPPRRGRPAVNRVELLRLLRGLGYEIGSGMIIGLPGQSRSSVADDLGLLRDLDLDMVALGPYVPHPRSPLGRTPGPSAIDQIPVSAEMTRTALALARLLCPEANIPATTALRELEEGGSHAGGLRSGANVVMLNVTPPELQRLYEIYPTRPPIPAEEARATLGGLFKKLGRHAGRGPGARARGRSSSP